MIEFSAKPDPQIVSTESGLAVQEVSLSRRPVDGKVFLLTAPFIEPPRLRLLRLLRSIFLMRSLPSSMRRGLRHVRFNFLMPFNRLNPRLLSLFK